jgi:hypothetical protein
MRKTNLYQKILVAFMLGVVVLWIGIQVDHLKTGNVNYFYSFVFGLIPLFGGIIGMAKTNVWGGLRSAIGRAVFFISLGLVCWGFGETIWSYYNFFRHVAAPYPSLADLGFAPSVFFWVLGAGFLSRASGAWLVLKRNWEAKTFAIIAVVALTVFSYYLLVHVARGGVLVPQGESLLKVILDLAYPLGDLLASIFAVLIYILSFKYFGGFYRSAILFILLGLAVMYFGDFTFSWTTTNGTYYNADWGDLVLAVGLFLLSFGILGFSTKPVVLKKASPAPVKEVK